MAALALVGCSPAEPAPTASARSTPSEQELVDDVRFAWERYLETLGELAADPEAASIDPLLEVATAHVADAQFANIEEAASVGARVEGVRRTIAFIPARPLEETGATVNVCVDTTRERVVDFAGVEIPRDDQALLRSQTVEFARQDASEDFVVSGDQDYAGSPEADPCA